MDSSSSYLGEGCTLFRRGKFRLRTGAPYFCEKVHFILRKGALYSGRSSNFWKALGGHFTRKGALRFSKVAHCLGHPRSRVEISERKVSFRGTECVGA